LSHIFKDKDYESMAKPELIANIEGMVSMIESLAHEKEVAQKALLRCAESKKGMKLVRIRR